MKRLIPIISGDPNSINTEIISKIWKRKSSFKNTDIFLVGNYDLIKKQFKKIGAKINVKKINDINGHNYQKKLHIFDVPLKFNDVFNVASKNKSSYIKNSFKAIFAIKKLKKISGFINCPINKRETFGKNFIGITEYLAKKEGLRGKEVMLIYNKKLSVSPITTHIKLNKVPKKLSKDKIIKNIITINNFYKKNLNIKPIIGILGLNPHNDEFRPSSEEMKIIIPAIKKLKNMKINVNGPIAPDTAFINWKKEKFNVLVGMYHDQVLTPFKTIYKFNAINITLGLPYLRVSPDHGVGRDIIKKNIANYQSLMASIMFLSSKNVKA